VADGARRRAARQSVAVDGASRLAVDANATFC
jgi:hypothetical protein